MEAPGSILEALGLNFEGPGARFRAAGVDFGGSGDDFFELFEGFAQTCSKRSLHRPRSGRELAETHWLPLLKAGPARSCPNGREISKRGRAAVSPPRGRSMELRKFEVGARFFSKRKKPSFGKRFFRDFSQFWFENPLIVY